VDKHKKSENAWLRSASMAGAAAAALAAVVGHLAIGCAKGPPSDLSLFVGRFHPLVVHLPIGIFLLVGAAELAALSKRLRARIDPALPLVLPLMVLSALSAFLLGHLLARSGGFPPRALLVHRTLALCAVMGSAACLSAWTHHAHVGSRAARGIYRILLALSLAALSVGAHFGGSMTHGETYLSKYAPAPFKPLLGGAERLAQNEAPAPPLARAEPLLFVGVVLPILRSHCVECHGSEKTKGKLRLDSLEGMLKGGEHGAALAPGNAGGSLMMQRILLPAAADDHMPPEGKAGPTPEQIAVLRFWIERGASATLRVRDTLAPPASRAELEKALLGQTPAAEAPSEAHQTHTDLASREASPLWAASAPTLGSTTRAARVPGIATASSEQVAQVLSERCGRCHGVNKPKAGLRLTSLADALRGAADGPVIVPGKPDKSLLVQRTHLPLGDEDHMPPKQEPQLAADELAAIAAWVQRGAKSSADLASRSGVAPERPSNGETASGADAAHGSIDRGAGGAPNPNLPEKAVLFRDVVRPLLTEKCGACHAGRAPIRHFRVDDYAMLMVGGKSGPAIIPNAPLRSPMLQRLTASISDSDHMPPQDRPQPSAGDIELIRTWIERGATADAIVDTASLSDLASVALAAQLAETQVSATGEPSAKPAMDEPSPPAALRTPVQTLRTRPGGCGACAVGGAGSAPLGVGALPLAALATLAVWRPIWRRSRAQKHGKTHAERRAARDSRTGGRAANRSSRPR
jgi:MYXO-CTERM domain-containing protein